MAEGLMLAFEGVGQQEYEAVNDHLGIDLPSGKGWPKGLLAHTAGTTDDGRFVVVEAWESRDAQAEFVSSRLGEALAAGGITGQPEVMWFSLLGAHRRAED
jgi:hypothetical protein